MIDSLDDATTVLRRVHDALPDGFLRRDLEDAIAWLTQRNDDPSLKTAIARAEEAAQMAEEAASDLERAARDIDRALRPRAAPTPIRKSA